ncbi:MAG: DoxX family protein [Myxococcota bacterium]
MFRLPRRLAKRLALLALVPFFVGAGSGHFSKSDFFMGIMPPHLPARLELVYLSGVLEILGGIAILIPPVHVLAGWGLIPLLLAMYPANIQMTLNRELLPDVSTTALYARLPMQLLFLAGTYWATRPDVSSDAESNE